MPFDGTIIDDPLLRRARLVEALRAPMPSGHTWDFGTYLDKTGCGTAGCAIGVAHLLWPHAKLIVGISANDEAVAEFFGMTEDEVDDVFYCSARYPNGNYNTITPDMVAEVLENL